MSPCRLFVQPSLINFNVSDYVYHLITIHSWLGIVNGSSMDMKLASSYMIQIFTKTPDQLSLARFNTSENSELLIQNEEKR